MRKKKLKRKRLNKYRPLTLREKLKLEHTVLETAQHGMATSIEFIKFQVNRYFSLDPVTDVSQRKEMQDACVRNIHAHTASMDKSLQAMKSPLSYADKLVLRTERGVL